MHLSAPLDFTKSLKASSVVDVDPQKYIIVETKATVSVNTEDSDSSVSDIKDFLIHPNTSNNVNSNGEAIETEFLRKVYSTYTGKPNYMEHLEESKFKRGFVLKPYLTEVADYLMLHLFIAVERKHKKLVSDILSKKVKYVSVGLNVPFSICSQCGYISKSADDFCPHILLSKGQTFLDKRGNSRNIAEIFGHVGYTNDSQFSEISWVKDPAYRIAEVQKVFSKFSAEEAMQVLEKSENAFKMAASNEDDEESSVFDEATPQDAFIEEVDDDVSYRDFLDLLNNEAHFLQKGRIQTDYSVKSPEAYSDRMMYSADAFSIFINKVFSVSMEEAFNFLKSLGFKRALQIMNIFSKLVFHESFSLAMLRENIQKLDPYKREFYLYFKHSFSEDI